MQTYEAADYRNAYARTMELAAYNQLFPEHASFALPAVETGGRAAGSSQTIPGFIPPVILKAVAWMESGWAQASYDPFVPYGEIGPTLISHDCGYGIMQVTSGMQNITGVPNLDQAMIGGHYAFNIARGARILADKWNQAPEFRPITGDRNPNVIEHWYYALWAYNGFAFKNHPLNPAYDGNRPPFSCGPANDGFGHDRGGYPYQELVLGCVAHPPVRGVVRLWDPIEVTLPDRNAPAIQAALNVANWEPCAINRACAPMDLPSPATTHQDPATAGVAREQVIGVPTLALSLSSLTFNAVPEEDSLSVNVTVANQGSGLLAWRVTGSVSWLKLNSHQGVSVGADLGSRSQTVSIYASASGVAPGTYSAEVTVESLFAGGGPTAIPVTFTVDLQAGASRAADFSGDGKTDLAFLCCTDTLSMWISQGGGAFSKTSYRPWQGYAMTSGQWLVGRFNNDGRADLFHVCCDDYVNVWFSNADGGFTIRKYQPWPGYSVRAGTWQVGDFNGDGNGDLLHLWGPSEANVWLSRGDGTFTVSPFRPWEGYGIQAGSWQATDVNGDGKTDLVHICCASYVNTWLSNGDGTFSVRSFEPWPGYQVGSGPWQSGDVTGDGKGDLIHLCCSDYMNVWTSRGDGSFAVIPFSPWPGYQVQSGFWIGGDLSADGATDNLHLCCADYLNSWRSNRDGSFTVSMFRPWPGYAMSSGFWQAGDFDGDGRLDLLHLCCHTAHMWRSDGGGAFILSTVEI